MNGFADDIEALTRNNKDFRHVLFTGKHLQLVVMSVKKKDEIGEEVHEGHDQFIRIERGKGVVMIDGEKHKLRKGDGIVIPAGARHNVINTGKKSLKLYTLYSPPEHEAGLVERNKAQSDEESERSSDNDDE